MLSDFCFSILFAVGCGDHDGVGIDLGDAEVAAEMNKIERAKFAGDLDDAHVAGGTGEDRDSSDVRTGEAEPEVGDGGVGLGSVGGGLVSVDEVLPTSGVVAGDD